MKSEKKMAGEKTTEDEKWQAMMASCRKACKILGEEFKEPEYLNWPLGSRYHDDLWTKVHKKSKFEKAVTKQPKRSQEDILALDALGKRIRESREEEEEDNPVDLSKIRGELVRLETDLEGKKPYLSEAFRESVEGAIGQMKMCNLRGALDQVEFASFIGSTLQTWGHPPRVNNIENLLKDLIVEIAIEACDCKVS